MTDDPYVRILNEFVNRLGESRATLWVDKRPEPYTFYFELRPKNPLAAPVSGNIENEGDIEITIGSVSTLLESNRDYKDPQQLELFRSICEAVMDGKYDETVYSVGGKRLGVVGTVHLREKEFKLRTIDRLSPKWLSGRKNVCRTAFAAY